MSRLITLLALAVLCISSVLAGSIVLTDENFEKKTQASTGATTGDWFVKFYAPWCGHCKKMAPDWETMADQLAGNINIASVDCVGEGIDTCKRFGVTGFPNLKMLAAGQAYEYTNKREIAEMTAFATGGYKEGEGSPVPTEPSVFDKIMEPVTQIPVNVNNFWKASPAAWMFIFGIGWVFGAITVYCLMPKSGKRSPPKGLQNRASNNKKQS
ncbi:hypothetical protein SARC_09490 [Sphaeroforma arctica JP610]|uniref:Thioredoxin domain-containing protein n=1 Tax=Sphaeroforma arctica JP610 TaxID=667725 RepID=A0A0L0FMU5_9EUKA|nr:hypothetical protein SARC_09490 [Sphaeroforma arctica JP610]KNC78069.1 hypothetical protein SARC_09490 [Sphaeroforma arctica JP610]|eukprot:XP_014151971.1 hypothetical protein SARC_09490 [Sphaeroforma arctica JP610]